MINPNPIIILGVHRSGTSIMSKILAKCGINMGIKQNINNESVFFHELNKEILQENNETGYLFSTTQNLLQSEEYLNRKAAYLKQSINKGLIKKHIGRVNQIKSNVVKTEINWGFKDPRNIILLPLWKKVYPEAKFIIIYRNPVDVCSSLYYFEQKRYKGMLKRNPNKIFDFYPDKSLKIWNEFMELLIEAEKSINCISIKYEEMHLKPELTKLKNFISSSVNEENLQKIIRPYKIKNNYPNSVYKLESEFKTNKFAGILNYDKIISSIF